MSASLAIAVVVATVLTIVITVTNVTALCYLFIESTEPLINIEVIA
ncbi:MAG: hypothetical protein AAF215_26000 [Cyanobacteria bacterium P01_A01_bin.123]